MVTRLLAVAAVALALGTLAAPAQAGGLGGQCDGKVDVACHPQSCTPDIPCEITICLVWTGTSCKV
jgi:hypothetical protein